MVELGQVVEKVRSKNAGPFWLTIDIFCGSGARFERARAGLETEQVARTLGIPSDALRRFDIPELNVIKFSLPRPAVQGAPEDRDMHGASWGALIAEMQIS